MRRIARISPVAWMVAAAIAGASGAALAQEKKIENNIQAHISEFETGLSDGFLTRIETLDDLMLTHPPVKYRYRLVIMIIMLIELMPLLTKLMMPSGLYEEKVEDAMLQKKLAWQNERAAFHEVEKMFYEKALASDKQLQNEVMAEIDAYRRKEAENYFNQWKQNPGKVRQFWEQLKSKLLYFSRN